LSEPGGGEHTLRLSSSGASATISFEAPAGKPPKFTAPPSVNSLKAVAVASFGSTAHLFGTERGVAVLLDGQPAGALGSEALVMENLSEGSHELTFGAGRDERRIVFDSTETPTLAVFVSSDRNVGSLLVTTGEDDVAIFLNGTEYRRKTARGRRLIYLYPKAYEVRVEKQGYRSPPIQTAEIRKGGEVRLEFEMTPLPQTATLRIANGLAGTDVWIDGVWRGAIRSGVFTLPSVEPGKHVIRLEKANYKTAEIEREFDPRATVELDGILESATGTLAIQLSPSAADVRLTLQREGESAPRPIRARSIPLTPGTYTVRASAPGFHDFATTIRVAADQTSTANVTLREREEQKANQPAVTLADWEKAGWQREGKLLVKRGGDFHLAENSGGAGRYTFTALLQRGRRLEWVVSYKDQNNYVFYQLGKDFLHRTVVSNGRRSRTIKIPHQMQWDDFLSVDVAVRADSIVHRLLIGENWIELDNWRQPGGNFTNGKFGFHLSGRDEAALSEFAFVPER
jgi:hypothetical protein